MHKNSDSSSWKWNCYDKDLLKCIWKDAFECHETNLICILMYAFYNTTKLNFS